MSDVTAQPELLTVDDFAALLQVSTRQIYLMEDDGRLGPARVQVGRAVRSRRREVENWIAASCPSRAEWLALLRDDPHFSKRVKTPNTPPEDL